MMIVLIVIALGVWVGVYFTLPEKSQVSMSDTDAISQQVPEGFPLGQALDGAQESTEMTGDISTAMNSSIARSPELEILINKLMQGQSLTLVEASELSLASSSGILSSAEEEKYFEYALAEMRQQEADTTQMQAMMGEDIDDDAMDVWNTGDIVGRLAGTSLSLVAFAMNELENTFGDQLNDPHFDPGAFTYSFDGWCDNVDMRVDRIFYEERGVGFICQSGDGALIFAVEMPDMGEGATFMCLDDRAFNDIESAGAFSGDTLPEYPMGLNNENFLQAQSTLRCPV